MRNRVALGVIVIVCLLVFTVTVSFVELDGWRTVEKLGGWYGWFINLLRIGWFGFALVRMVALFLVVLAVRRVWRWSRAAGASVAALLVLGVTILILITSYSPAGVYGDIDEYAYDTDHYYILSGGRFENVYKNDVLHLGHYEKTAGGWILTETDNSRYKLKPSWFGIWMINVEFPESREVLGRRIIPFLRPDWIPKWLQ
jgi:hypothetical protein